jgi:hypothetical protein
LTYFNDNIQVQGLARNMADTLVDTLVVDMVDMRDIGFDS